MADGKSKEAWCHTASLMAHIVHMNPHCKKRGVTMFDYHPLLAKHDRPREKGNIRMLRSIFCKGVSDN